MSCEDISPAAAAGFPPDEELARRIGRGDAAAEQEFARRFTPGLRALATLRAGDQAADLAQEALALALANLRRGAWRGEGALSSYVAGILRYLVARRGARTRIPRAEVAPDHLPSPDLDPEEAASRAERRIRLRAALARLPEAQRDVLLRHYFDDQTTGSIARELRIPRGTVLSRLYHARQRLTRLLNQDRTAGH